ncbi:hypothetical protein B0H17DRAFT_1241742, partial [Mycena rosella]
GGATVQARVRPHICSPQGPEGQQDVLRLQRAQSQLVLRHLRCLPLPRLLRAAPQHGRAHHFVRSTNLDAWSAPQLRAMKVGGNAAFAAFLHKHGSSGLTGRARYEGRVGELYREELGRRVKADEAAF